MRESEKTMINFPSMRHFRHLTALDEQRHFGRAAKAALIGERKQHHVERTGFEATSLATLVKLVDDGFGVTLLPTLAVDAGLLSGTRVVTRPLLGDLPARQIGIVWRRKTGRGAEFRLLSSELSPRPQSEPTSPPRVQLEDADAR
jgi:hypothetical protein